MRKGELPAMLSMMIVVPVIGILAAIALPYLFTLVHEPQQVAPKSISSAEAAELIRRAVTSDTRFEQALSQDSEVMVFVVQWRFRQRLGLLATDTVIARWRVGREVITLDSSDRVPSPDVGTRFIAAITPALEKLRIEWRSVSRPAADFCWETAVSNEYRILSLSSVESLNLSNNAAMIDGCTFAEISDTDAR